MLEYPKEIEEQKAEACPEREDAILASTGVLHLVAFLLSTLPYFSTCDRCHHSIVTLFPSELVCSTSWRIYFLGERPAPELLTIALTRCYITIYIKVLYL